MSESLDNLEEMFQDPEHLIIAREFINGANLILGDYNDLIYVVYDSLERTSKGNGSDIVGEDLAAQAARSIRHNADRRRAALSLVTVRLHGNSRERMIGAKNELDALANDKKDKVESRYVNLKQNLHKRSHRYSEIPKGRPIPRETMRLKYVFK